MNLANLPVVQCHGRPTHHLTLLSAFVAALTAFSVNAQQPSSTAPVVPTIVTTEQLHLDFVNNELAAEQRYGGGLWDKSVSLSVKGAISAAATTRPHSRP